ncbi:MAG: radical SAM protein [Pseudomonadota bacterium]
MKVLFLEIDTEATWAVCSLGPAFLASVARDLGHEVELLRIGNDWPLRQAAEAVAARAPDLIGVSLTSRQWLRARAVIAALRQAGPWPVICGGLHATFSPELVLAADGVDAVCLGEGEGPFTELLRHLDAGLDLRDAEIRNIWLKGGRHPGLAPPLPEIDALPFLARDMLDEYEGCVHMATQRGCPFPCTYCAARMYDQLYDGIGTYGRRRSVQSVMAEFDAIRAAGPLHYAIFLDDTFTINHPWVFEFCEVMPDRVGIGFSLHARAETMNPKLIEALARAGCKHIVYGVESGSERVRREIMKRPVKNERLVEVFQRTKDAGIMVTANYMMGVPGETREDMQATIDLHHRLKPLDFGYFVFYPFPGTQLFEVCRQRGYLPEDWAERPARHDSSILSLPDMSASDIEDVFAQWTDIQTEAQEARMAAATA